MNEEAGFLSAIRQAPADDTARLAFADWLEEKGDPDGSARAAFLRLELRTSAAPEKSLNRVRSVKQLQKLAAALDPGWLAVVSHPKLEACRLQFQFACPKQWEALTPTEIDTVRFCASCRQSVHYCDTIEEARAHAAGGNCVAVSPALVRTPDDLVTPRLRVRRTLGRVLPHAIRRPAAPPPDPVPLPPPPSPEWVPGPDPPRGRRRKARRSKGRGRNRNLQREEWEGTDG